ncbi:MAG: DUF2817 domain-containing protein [Bdellovibrionaceae bacterium]|nr:DUF2817 domain-containing protein [Pseudobdellovibrionaceae bacterium]
MKFFWTAILVLLFQEFFGFASAKPLRPLGDGTEATSEATSEAKQSLAKECETRLAEFPGPRDIKLVKKACEKVVVFDGCVSEEGRRIFHYDSISKMKGARRILVFSMIHGDERPAGSVGRYWMERLESIQARNTWRVVPILNPDGVVRGTRPNARGVDLNRNFPTRDWHKDAIQFWKTRTGSDPRRNPGDAPASESETLCALQHIKNFKPDFVVSIHTPLRVLDFDGPKDMKPPKFDYLPWKSLGHFPGSLGRFLWMDHKIPVLTAEMKEDLPRDYAPLEQLQDVIGGLVALDRSTDPKEIEVSGSVYSPEPN